MKRYKLIEATALYETDINMKEKISNRISEVLSPIKNMNFKLDWNTIEDKLGGPVADDVKMRVEKECDNLTFTGFKFSAIIAIISIGLFSMFTINILWTVLLIKEALIAFLIFLISAAALLIFAYIHNKRLSKTGINECVKAVEYGKPDYKIAREAINNSAIADFISKHKIMLSCVTAIIFALIIYIDIKHLSGWWI